MMTSKNSLEGVEGRILLVDDDEDDIAIFQMALSSVSSQVNLLIAGSGRDALNLLNLHEAELPLVVFLDLNMPVMNGFECLEAMKRVQMLSSLPVVVLTTSSDENDRRNALQLGADSFFTKPSAFDEMCEILRTVLFRHGFQTTNGPCK